MSKDSSTADDDRDLQMLIMLYMVRKYPGYNLSNFNDLLIVLLQDAIRLKDKRKAADAFILGNTFNLFGFSREKLQLLNQLLLETWHQEHERIVNILYEYKNSESLHPVYLFLTELNRVKQYNTEAYMNVARKCMDTIAANYTHDIDDKLEYLTKYGNPVISSLAQKIIDSSA